MGEYGTPPRASLLLPAGFRELLRPLRARRARGELELLRRLRRLRGVGVVVAAAVLLRGLLRLHQHGARFPDA